MRFKGSIFYEGIRFSKSDIVNRWFQPESKADILGVSAGLTF